MTSLGYAVVAFLLLFRVLIFSLIFQSIWKPCGNLANISKNGSVSVARAAMTFKMGPHCLFINSK